jgi:hypothetical protein
VSATEAEAEEAEDEIDMLDSVKQAYLQSCGNKRRPRKKEDMRRPIQSHPEFDQNFEKLEPLSEERSSLPAAQHVER